MRILNMIMHDISILAEQKSLLKEKPNVSFCCCCGGQELYLSGAVYAALQYRNGAEV